MRARSLLLLAALGAFGGAALPACGAAKRGPAASGGAATVGAASATPPEVAEVDAAIRRAWAARGLHPAATVDDAGFLRRAWLDVAGVIPPPEAVVAFLDDPRPDKRARAVDALLASPRWADHMTDAWDDLLMGDRPAGPVVDRAAFRGWLRDRFARDVSWAEIVRDLVGATGRNSAGGAVRPRLSRFETTPPAPGVNGAVNWFLRYQDAPQDLAGTASKLFLGVQIQCAQCHDHKTEPWKQDDFRRFTACFARTKVLPIDPPKTAGVRRVAIEDEVRAVRRPKRRAGAWAEYDAARPTTLDGRDLSGEPDARAALAAWIVADDNPWFAEATVNRVWAHMLGRGFVEPVDDHRPSNPPLVPEAQTLLAKGFVRSGHSLRWLVRAIAATEAYQRASAPASDRTASEEAWATFRVTPLAPRELLDSIAAATGLDALLEVWTRERAHAVELELRRRIDGLFDVDEEVAPASFEGTIPQALFLLDGALVHDATSAVRGGALAKLLATNRGDAERVEALWIRALSRRPTAEETAAALAFLGEARPSVRTSGAVARGLAAGRLGRAVDRLPADARREAWEDLFWALLNSSEFVFDH